MRALPAVRRRTAAALAAACALAAASAAAQPPDEPPAEPPPPTAWSWGLRAGLFEMVNAPDAYDAVFGEPMPRIGAQLEADWRARWRFAASVDVGRVEGERVLLTDPPRGTGIDEELTTVPLHLTAAYRFRPGARWDLYAGLGPSLLHWRDETDFDSESGTDLGGSVVAGLRRQPPAARWRFGGELRWSTFPGALPEEGVAGFFDEDDPGGLSLTFLALRRF
jgi:opacity protein-like surface antigen